METFCGLVVVIIIGFIIFEIKKSIDEEEEKRKKEHEKKLAEQRKQQLEIEAQKARAIAVKNRKISELKDEFNNQHNQLLRKESEIEDKIKEFFIGIPKYVDMYGRPIENEIKTYYRLYEVLNKIISNMQSTIEQMKRINNTLVNELGCDDQSVAIAQEESRVIPKAKKIAEGLEAFHEKVYTIPFSQMMDDTNYGKINKTYWNSVCDMQRSDAVDYVSNCSNLLRSNQFSEIYAIDLEKILKCAWFFAIEKTFSVSDFQLAESVFSKIYKDSHADLIIAGLYIKKKIGGVDVLPNSVRDILKNQYNPNILLLIASGLMWMNAYQSENAVLQHMLTSGMKMTQTAQERLHALTNGAGKAPSGFDVQSSASSFYFDVSALAWKEEDYTGLFENLAFQNKVLSYSLALRDENKELFLPQGFKMLSTDVVLNKLRSVFSEQYESGVVAQSVNCIALSGSGEEKLDGILVFSDECKQMGILIHIAKIGKKLIIKFYTLFMPIGSDLAVQKQQALSMYQKLSPLVTMWESSLKDTMLMAVEQLLNTSVQFSSGEINTDATSKEPIF